MPSISSPIDDSDSEVSDDRSSVYDEDDFRKIFVLRFTPQGKYSMEDLQNYLEESFEFYVLAHETHPKDHFHVVIETDEELKEVKERCRGFVYQYWPEGERKKGFGNAQYNCQPEKVRTPENEHMLCPAISYALKDKEEYFYKGYDQEYIDRCIEESFPKKDTKTFKIEYEELCSKFQITDMDIREFMISFAKLKSKYGQQVQMQQAYSYAVSNHIKRNPNIADEYVENYLYKI